MNWLCWMHKLTRNFEASQKKLQIDYNDLEESNVKQCETTCFTPRRYQVSLGRGD
jgi:hypothetical protein